MKKICLLLLSLLCANQVHGMYRARAALKVASAIAAAAITAHSLTSKNDPKFPKLLPREKTMVSYRLPFKLLPDQAESGRHVISFVQDADARGFVIKGGLKRTPKKEQYQAKITGENKTYKETIIREMFASIIAQQSGIPLNKVSLITQDECPDSLEIDSIATLHTQAPGKPVGKRKDLMDFCIDIHCIGYHENFLKALTKSHDLPAIVALDLFLGNSDRTPDNIFHDGEKYTGIDMECIYLVDPSRLTNIYKELLKYHSSRRLRAFEHMAVNDVHYNLKFLVSSFSPDELIQLWHEQAQAVGLNYTQEERKIIERKIRKTYYAAHDFVVTLNHPYLSPFMLMYYRVKKISS